MTVNAVAKDLGKKVLLVDFGSLSGRKDGSADLDADLRGLFREAHMSNAVLHSVCFLGPSSCVFLGQCLL